MECQRVCRLIILLLTAASALAACDGVTQEAVLIGSYPRTGLANWSTPRSLPPSDSVIVHTAYLEMAVDQLEPAVDRLISLVYENGGYLVEVRSGQWHDDRRATVILAVPAAGYEAAYRGLLKVGRLTGERVSETVLSSGYGLPFSQITLDLSAQPPQPPSAVVTIDLGQQLRQSFESVLVAAWALITFFAGLASRLLRIIAPVLLILLGLRLLAGRQGKK